MSSGLRFSIKHPRLVSPSPSTARSTRHNLFYGYGNGDVHVSMGPSSSICLDEVDQRRYNGLSFTHQRQMNSVVNIFSASNWLQVGSVR
jgi:hypothetical protein